MKLHCFHGFLGDKDEFDFLRNQYDVHSYDMYELCSGSKDKAYENIKINDGDVVIGYSFGSRFALELFKRFNPKMFFALAGHAGPSEADRADRLKIELNFLSKLKNLSQEDFMAYWNGLDLFKYDTPIAPTKFPKNVLINMFVEFGLSKQTNYSEVIKSKSSQIVWVNGELDHKYSSYSKEHIAPLGVECVYLSGGHRLLQNKEAVLKIIKNKLDQL